MGEALGGAEEVLSGVGEALGGAKERNECSYCHLSPRVPSYVQYEVFTRYVLPLLPGSLHTGFKLIRAVPVLR